MGIDYDSKIFFGIEITYEQLQHIEEIFGFDIDEMIYEEAETAFNRKYKDLYIGMASSYYNSSFEDNIIFIGIGEPLENVNTIEQIKHLLDNWKTTSYTDCLKECGIEFQEPKLCSYPHVY